MGKKISKTDPRYPIINLNPLRVYRKLHKLTLVQVADTLCCSKQNIYSWESGKSCPNEVNWTKLKELMGINRQEWIAWKKLFKKEVKNE